MTQLSPVTSYYLMHKVYICIWCLMKKKTRRCTDCCTDCTIIRWRGCTLSSSDYTNVYKQAFIIGCHAEVIIDRQKISNLVWNELLPSSHTEPRCSGVLTCSRRGEHVVWGGKQQGWFRLLRSSAVRRASVFCSPACFCLGAATFPEKINAHHLICSQLFDN